MQDSDDGADRGRGGKSADDEEFEFGDEFSSRDDGSPGKAKVRRVPTAVPILVLRQDPIPDVSHIHSASLRPHLSRLYFLPILRPQRLFIFHSVCFIS